MDRFWPVANCMYTVEAWVAELCRRFGRGPIAVPVEQVKGALVFMLRKYELSLAKTRGRSERLLNQQHSRAGNRTHSPDD